MALHVSVGPALIYFAPKIAARFYPAEAEQKVHLTGVSAGDIYHVACFVLGAYLLVLSAEPASRIVLTTMTDPHSAWAPASIAREVVLVAFYVGVGGFLAFGSLPISRFFSKVHADAASIPKQRLGVAMLLAAFLVLAAVLALLRGLASYVT